MIVANDKQPHGSVGTRSATWSRESMQSCHYHTYMAMSLSIPCPIKYSVAKNAKLTVLHGPSNSREFLEHF